MILDVIPSERSESRNLLFKQISPLSDAVHRFGRNDKSTQSKKIVVTGHTIVGRRRGILQPFLPRKKLFGLFYARDEVCNRQQ